MPPDALDPPPSDPLGPSDSLGPLDRGADDSTDPRDPNPEADDWLRRLAERMVHDPATADDIAQETWVASLESLPTGQRASRAWLSVVARVKLLDLLRRRERRERREREGARRESTPSTSDLASRRSVARALRAAVAELPEPYATIVRRRFFDEEPLREIARELGKPQNTVKTQLAKALAMLRENLDRRTRGDRTKWMGALVALAGEDRRTRAVRAGGIAGAWFVSRWLWTGATAAAVALLFFFVWTRGASTDARSESTVARSSDASAAQPALGVDGAPAAPADVAPERVAEANASAARSILDTPPVVLAPEAALHIRLVAPDLHPLGETRVWYRPRSSREFAEVATTSADGRAAIPYSIQDLVLSPYDPKGPREKVLLRFSGPEYDQPDVWFVMGVPQDGVERVIVLEDTLGDVSGTVEEFGTGQSIPFANIRVVSSMPSPIKLGPPSTHEPIVVADDFERRTDENGHFSISRLPSGRLRFIVTATGYLKSRTEFPDTLRGRHAVSLRMYPAPKVSGCVRDALGRVVAGAVVRCETQSNDASTETTTGPDGTFMLDLTEEDQPIDVVASDPTHPAASARTRVTPKRGEKITWDPVLQERAGILIDVLAAGGAPVPGALVRFVRSTQLTQPGVPGRWSPERTSDAAGRVELYDDVDEPIDALVHAPTLATSPPALHVTGLLPRAEPWRVELPDPAADLATFTASVRADGWTLDQDPYVFLCLPEIGYRARVGLREGRTYPLHLIPGPCYVSVGAPELGMVHFGPFDLRAGQPYDAGELVLPPRARIDWICDGLEHPEELAWVTSALPAPDGISGMEKLVNGLGLPPRSIECLSGTTVLRLVRNGREVSRRFVHVDPGATTNVVEVPAPETTATLRARFDGWGGRIGNVGIYREPGRVALLQRFEMLDANGAAEFRFAVEPGEYSVATSTGSFRDARWHPLRVPPEGCAGMSVDVRH